MSEISFKQALALLRRHGVTHAHDISMFVDECWDIYAIDRTAEGERRVIDAAEVTDWLTTTTEEG